MRSSLLVLILLSACFSPVDTREAPCPCAAGFECCPGANVCRAIGTSCVPPARGARDAGVVPLPFRSDDRGSAMVLSQLTLPASLASFGDVIYVLARLGPDCAEASTPYRPALTRFDVSQGALTWAWTTVLPAGASVARFVASADGATVVGSGALEGQPTRGGKDAFVLRVRPDGTLAWVRQFGTIFEDSAGFLSVDLHAAPRSATNVVVSADGSTLVAGVTSGSLEGQPAQGGVDAFVARLGADGSLGWVRLFGSSNDEAVHKLIAMPDDSVVLVLGTEGVIQPGHVNAQPPELFLARLETSGVTRWSRQLAIAPSGVMERWGDDLAWVGYDSTVTRLSGGDGTTLWARPWAGDGGAGYASEFVPLDADRASLHGFANLHVIAPTPWSFELFEHVWSSDGGVAETPGLGGGWPQMGALMVENPLLAHGPDGTWYAGGASSTHPVPDNLVTITRQAPLGGAREELRRWLFDQPAVAQEGFLRANIFPTAMVVTDDASRVVMGPLHWAGCLDVHRVWVMGF